MVMILLVFFIESGAVLCANFEVTKDQCSAAGIQCVTQKVFVRCPTITSGPRCFVLLIINNSLQLKFAHQPAHHSISWAKTEQKDKLIKGLMTEISNVQLDINNGQRCFVLLMDRFIC